MSGSRTTTVAEASRECRLPRRTLYHWITTGELSADRGRVSVGDVVRIRSSRPGTIYRQVMKIRNCGYDAARMWVHRRRAKGLSDDEITAALLAL